MSPAVVSRSTRRSGTKQENLREHKKVCAFIDNSALYKALLSQKRPDARIDYRELLNSLVRGRTLAQARFYCSEFSKDFQQKTGFYTVLQDAGFEVKRTRFKGHRSRKRNPALDSTLNRAIHTSMAWDMCDLSNHDDYDVFVVVSGGKEHTSTIQNLVLLGIEVEVVFFGEVTSHELISAATSFRELSEFCVIED